METMVETIFTVVFSCRRGGPAFTSCNLYPIYKRKGNLSRKQVPVQAGSKKKSFPFRKKADKDSVSRSDDDIMGLFLIRAHQRMQ